MDTIFIKNLRIDTIIGIYDWEKEQRQEVVFDIEVASDTNASAVSDDIRDTVNYKTITDRIVAFVKSGQFELVETLAETVASIILAEFDTNQVSVQLTKPGVVYGGADVGVRIARTREQCMRHAYVGLGSNVNPAKNMQRMLEALQATFGALIISPFYKNPAVGFNGGEFINAVVGFDTPLNAFALVDKLRAMELELGKDEGAQSYTPREIDMDLLTLGDVVVKAPTFALPRKGIEKFAFVIKPLADIAGGEMHPLLKKSYSNMLNAIVAENSTAIDALEVIEL